MVKKTKQEVFDEMVDKLGLEDKTLEVTFDGLEPNIHKLHLEGVTEKKDQLCTITVSGNINNAAVGDVNVEWSISLGTAQCISVIPQLAAILSIYANDQLDATKEKLKG